MKSAFRVVLIVLLMGLELLIWVGLPAAPPPLPARPTVAVTPIPAPAATRVPGSGPQPPAKVKVSGKTRQEQERRQVARLSRETEALRHLRFEHVVPTEERTREQARRYIQRELDRDTDWKAQETTLKQFGFVPERFELRPYYLDFYTSQVAGWYDPDDGAYHMIRGETPDLATRALELAGDFMGSGASMDVEEISIVHELDHALTDQHFRLERLEDRVVRLKNDDATMATQSLVEGDATVVMYHAQYRRMGLNPDAIRLDAGGGESMQWLTNVFANAEFRSAPLYFQKVLLFPYLTGCAFVDYQRRLYGWRGVNQMYAHPPQSTEQILHPEKYRLVPDPPLRIEWSPVAPAPAGWRKLAQNTLGELGIRVFLEVQGLETEEASNAATGWGGDAWRIYAPPGGPADRVLVWTTAWDTLPRAVRFTQAVCRAMAHKHGQADDAGTAEGMRWKLPLAGRRQVSVECRGRRVVVLENVPAGQLEELRRMAWEARVR